MPMTRQRTDDVILLISSNLRRCSERINRADGTVSEANDSLYIGVGSVPLPIRIEELIPSVVIPSRNATIVANSRFSRDADARAACPFDPTQPSAAKYPASHPYT